MSLICFRFHFNPGYNQTTVSGMMYVPLLESTELLRLNRTGFSLWVEGRSGEIGCQSMVCRYLIYLIQGEIPCFRFRH